MAVAVKDERSLFQSIAATRFSDRGARADVRGDGNFYLGTKCGRKNILLLFQNVDKANDRWRQWRTVGCGPDCYDAHYRGVLLESRTQ